MNSSEKEKIRRRLAAQHFLENISLDGNKQLPKNYAKKHRSISENNSKKKLSYSRYTLKYLLLMSFDHNRRKRRRRDQCTFIRFGLYEISNIDSKSCEKWFIDSDTNQLPPVQGAGKVSIDK